MTPAPSAPPAGSLVLVVEDDPAIATMLQLQLEVARAPRGHGRGDGRVALETCAGSARRRSLLDIGLPGLDGIEVCRALRAGDDWTPVIFLTARDDEVDRVVGLELGADDYVTKPFSPARGGRPDRQRPAAQQPRRGGRGRGAALGEVAPDPHERQVFVAGDEIVSPRPSSTCCSTS